MYIGFRPIMESFKLSFLKIKTLTFFKVYAATVFTALTAQNTRGVNKVFNVPIHFIEEQIKAIAQDLDISYIKVGMLSNKKI